MKYLPLGKSGLEVSQYILGTLTFGGDHGFDRAGSVGGALAKRMIDMSLDSGVNAIDTANLYSFGQAEDILRGAIGSKRADLLLFSKARFSLRSGPNGGGASRAHLIPQVEASLKRLGTDWLDVFFIHGWDGVTPVEETIEVMSTLIRSGKIRYWGVSNYSGWQLAKTALLAPQMGGIAPVTQQIYYTPEGRDAEYELLAAGQELGLSSMIWSPLGQGLLNGMIDRHTPPADGTRQGSTWTEPHVADRERLYRVIDALKLVAHQCGRTVPQVALAWVRQRPNVDSLVLGARTEAQLAENLASIDLVLDDAQMGLIEEAGRPPAIYPFWHRSQLALDRPTSAEAGYLKGWRAAQGLAQ
ncbi:aldo/keto reductase [Pseudomonas tolaasii]|uniref:Aldo/keto reductase n=2 Tax=Pseudomonas tolaasii TaxID=29442 RepID=A0A7Y8ATI2_PSETO|nr:aldo/keto reductase [Pseudomonas tolaasii]ARB25887.1 aldo/keto reductase [Pseudomonas tolaasii]KAB0467534.1 aldo/keto reductase [Pseudomonas tolaasii]MBW1250635.1 aldo/keto reductase [Pseudomonas tolaasii]MBY8944174.1 aldo/keto reductase [Pseudomonas tolaasii]NVZ46299.1 aldo/keto reductase [Pseudomonas tolaasii]